MSERSIEHVGGSSADRETTSARSNRRGSVSKRLGDVLVASTLLVLLSPIFVVCSVAIKLDSRGPVFYRAHRRGWKGRPLAVLKFRKMYDGATGAALTSESDLRFTRVGQWLARTKLDELPQLVNVIRGDMSLVGPRPEDAMFVALHEDAYREILRVRPGITGLAQLAFAKEAEILDEEGAAEQYVDSILPQKVRIDLLYARHRTFRQDLRIMVWTVLPVVLRVDVAVNRRTGELTVRRRAADSSRAS